MTHARCQRGATALLTLRDRLARRPTEVPTRVAVALAGVLGVADLDVMDGTLGAAAFERILARCPALTR